MSYSAAVALGAAIEYVLKLGPNEILRHTLDLTGRLMRGLSDLGAQLLTPVEDSRRAGTVTARFPGKDNEALAVELTRRGVIVSPRVGSTRYSAHFYNTADDIDTALNVTADALKL